MQFILQFSRLKQQQSSTIRSCYDSLIWDPGLAQKILGFHFLESKLLQISLTVTEQLENSISNHTQLSIVLRIEGYLWK